MKITETVLRSALKLPDCPEFEASRIVIDSRQVKSGDLFIAIRNGNTFVRDALSNGASLAIIDDEKYFIRPPSNPPESGLLLGDTERRSGVYTDVHEHSSTGSTQQETDYGECGRRSIDGKTVLVGDSLEALKAIGNYVKIKAEPRALVGITGSVGKTTTRQWLHSVLSYKFQVVSSMRNYNTIYGMPLCLATLETSTDFGIFEIGSSGHGEVAELANYLNPDVGAITTICEAHIGKFGNMENIIHEKMSIINGIKSGGTVVYDGDLECSSDIKEHAASAGITPISVGFNSDSEFAIISFGEDGNHINLRTPVGSIEYGIVVPGRHFTYISACVFAIIYAMGLDIREFLECFRELRPIEGRGLREQHVIGGRQFTLIDDSYNASPTSMLAALDSLDALDSISKVAVIGQMGELGAYTTYYHTVIAEKLRSMKLAKLFFIGDSSLFDTMSCHEHTACFEAVDDAVIEEVLQAIQDGSVVLLKGSRSAALDKIASHIRRNSQQLSRG